LGLVGDVGGGADELIDEACAEVVEDKESAACCGGVEYRSGDAAASV